MKIIFYLNAKLYHNSRQQFFQDVETKYSKFVDLNKSEKVIFLFNNIDRYVGKKLGYFMSMKHFNSMRNRDFYL